MLLTLAVFALVIRVSKCTAMANQETIIHPPEYYQTITNLMSKGNKEAAFIMMNMISSIDQTDITYWTTIPMLVLNVFNNDEEKLYFYGIRIAKKNGTNELSLCFAQRLIEIDQVSKAWEIINVAARHQFGIEILFKYNKPQRDGESIPNQYALGIYRLARRFDSPCLYGIFHHLFEKIDNTERYVALYPYYLQALSRLNTVVNLPYYGCGLK